MAMDFIAPTRDEVWVWHVYKDREHYMVCPECISNLLVGEGWTFDPLAYEMCLMSCDVCLEELTGLPPDGC